MYKISHQLSCVLNVYDKPFGGMNMVFAGDFAQLPPAIGGENISLYSRFIGTRSSDKKSQEESIGKALWQQVTTVVILRQNLRQQKQSEDDNKFRTALENMRYKSCTLEDIIFLRSRISSKLPNKPCVTDENFRDISIITAKNIHKDEINRVGALRFAQETGQTLTDFYSEDNPKIRENNISKSTSRSKILNIKEISNEMQEILWNQLPSTTDKHIAGKLSLCIGLPIMIRHNFATELCITKGQEGYVYGWQSKIGSKKQRILDTLFVKLKNPPSTVQFDGLPENVVPITASTQVIKAALLKDAAVKISRTQVEVLVNFSMTDFASQGKTRPNNVVDLNNLSTHQSYYTALSRSATSQGTIILQGFDSSKITGHASGALRQEFRELELLDEITALNFSKNLHITVVGESRGILIKSFRKWKGENYVPKNVHKAIRWSKHDPLNESEIFDTWFIKTKNDKQDNILKQYKFIADEPQSKKRKLEKINKTIYEKHELVQPKKICLNQIVTLSENVPLVPRGISWSQNSCGYDAALTILYSMWSENSERWTKSFEKIENPYLNALAVGFKHMQTTNISFEAMRDNFRYFLQASNRQEFKFGQYISITTLFETLCEGSDNIQIVYRVCINQHSFYMHNSSSVLISTGTNSFNSINQWISTYSEPTRQACNICNSPLYLKYTLENIPEFLVFDFGGRDHLEINKSFLLNKDGIQYLFKLKGVIYFSQNHFTSRIITRNGQIWFHDGMTLQHSMRYEGLLDTELCPNIFYSNNGNAVLAIYTQYR